MQRRHRGLHLGVETRAAAAVRGGESGRNLSCRCAGAGVRFAAHPLAKVLLGFGKLAEEHTSVAKVEVGSCITWVKVYHLLEFSTGLGKIRFCEILGTKIVVGRIVIRSNIERLQIVPDGVFLLAILIRLDAPVELFARFFWETFLIFRGGNGVRAASLVSG